MPFPSGLLPPIYDAAVWPFLKVLDEAFAHRVHQHILTHFLKRSAPIKNPIITAFLQELALQPQLPSLLCGKAFKPTYLVYNAFRYGAPCTRMDKTDIPIG